MLFKRGGLGRKNWQSSIWRLVFLRACFKQQMRQFGDAFVKSLARATIHVRSEFYRQVCGVL
jgi:hypothetical protein